MKTIFKYLIIYFIISIIAIGCVEFRNLEQVGDKETLSSRFYDDIEVFKLIHTPSFNNPMLEIKFGKVPRYKISQRSVFVGEKKTSYAWLIGGALLGYGAYAMLTSSGGIDGPDSSKVTGAWISLFWGGLCVLADEPGSAWEETTLESLEDTIVIGNDEFQPIPFAKIDVTSTDLSKSWSLETNENGLARLDVSNINNSENKEYDINFYYPEAGHIGYSYIVKSSLVEKFMKLKSFEISLKNLAEKLKENLISNKKANIAVIDFQNLEDITTDFGKYLSEELITRLFQTKKFHLIERRFLKKILKEHKLENTGLFDLKSIKKMGKILGVDAIISGTYTELASEIKVNARLIDVENGRLLAVSSAYLPSNERISKLLHK